MSDSSKIILSEKIQQSFEALPIFVFLKAYFRFEMMKVVIRVLVLPDMQACCLAREPCVVAALISICSRCSCCIQIRQECKQTPFSTLVEINV